MDINQEKIDAKKAYQRAYYEKNKMKILSYMRQYYDKKLEAQGSSRHYRGKRQYIPKRDRDRQGIRFYHLAKPHVLTFD